MPHTHTFKLLDVEKRRDSEARYSDTYFRTTRLFCEKCAEIKEVKESVTFNINDDDRPDWTFNIKN